jgi:hypothetical protein
MVFAKVGYGRASVAGQKTSWSHEVRPAFRHFVCLTSLDNAAKVFVRSIYLSAFYKEEENKKQKKKNIAPLYVVRRFWAVLWGNGVFGPGVYLEQYAPVVAHEP